MRRNQLVLNLCALVLVTGCLPVTADPGQIPAQVQPGATRTAQSPQNDSLLAADTSQVLKPGDVVRITVWRNPELSGDFPVGANGALRQPLYQAVPIAGVPIPEVESRLTKFLEQYQTNPAVVVEPLFQVIVGGEVRAPKVYELPRETTISMAIAQAGGSLPDGRMDKVRLLRAGKEYVLDLTRADAAWADAPILSGDQIIVTQRSQVFRQVVLPIVSLVGALASVINLIRR